MGNFQKSTFEPKCMNSIELDQSPLSYGTPCSSVVRTSSDYLMSKVIDLMERLDRNSLSKRPE